MATIAGIVKQCCPPIQSRRQKHLGAVLLCLVFGLQQQHHGVGILGPRRPTFPSFLAPRKHKQTLLGFRHLKFRIWAMG